MSEENVNERRRYFRIEDEIILFFNPIKPEQMPEGEGLHEYAIDAFSLSSQLDVLTLESRGQLRKIEREYPEVADFLKTLERKVDLIGRSLLSKDVSLAEQTTRRVNLSASGLAFQTNDPHKLGTLLELKMILPPSLVGIVAYGRIVSCGQVRDQRQTGFQLAVDFVGLRSRDRELLIRHVVKKQMRQLREQKRPAQ